MVQHTTQTIVQASQCRKGRLVRMRIDSGCSPLLLCWSPTRRRTRLTCRKTMESSSRRMKETRLASSDHAGVHLEILPLLADMLAGSSSSMVYCCSACLTELIHQISKPSLTIAFDTICAVYKNTLTYFLPVPLAHHVTRRGRTKSTHGRAPWLIWD